MKMRSRKSLTDVIDAKDVAVTILLVSVLLFTMMQTSWYCKCYSASPISLHASGLSLYHSGTIAHSFDVAAHHPIGVYKVFLQKVDEKLCSFFIGCLSKLGEGDSNYLAFLEAYNGIAGLKMYAR